MCGADFHLDRKLIARRQDLRVDFWENTNLIALLASFAAQQDEALGGSVACMASKCESRYSTVQVIEERTGI